MIFCTSSLLLAQSNDTIQGVVVSWEDGHPLSDVSVSHLLSDRGTTTDSLGRFVLEIPRHDIIALQFNFLGFSEVNITLDKEDLYHDIVVEMYKTGIEITPIVISANTNAETEISNAGSIEHLTTEDSKYVPILFGESDLFKTIQLKPGISSGSEGSSNLFVRGGNGDQNLILLDGATIYNPSHLFGFFSTFYSDALSSVSVHKGGFPAEYGGRLSSVINVKSKQIQNDSLHLTGGLGLISSRLAISGPITKGKTHFLISGRRTYIDLFTKPVNKKRADNDELSPIPLYFFYDINAKLSHKWSESNQVALTFYNGSDRLEYDNELFNFQFKWRNLAAILNWNYKISDQIQTEFYTTFTNYQYDIANNLDDFKFDIGSHINDYKTSGHIEYHLSNHRLQLGMDWIYRQFSLGQIQAGSTDGEIQFEGGSSPSGHEYGIYLKDEFSWTPHFNLKYGIRYSGYLQSSGSYHNLEPRIALNYRGLDNWSFTASYAKMSQYIHLLSNSGLSLPTDLWHPSTASIEPQQSHQWAIGLNYKMGKGISFRQENYYKTLSGQIEVKDHQQILTNEDIGSSLTFGRGYAYGSEWSIEKEQGKLTGWIGYSLAWVKRGEFSDIDNGSYFPPRHDRRHDLSTVANLAVNKKWSVSATFIFGSGDKAWLPSGRFSLQDIDGINSQAVVPIYGQRNSVSLPSYHRLDLSIHRHFKASWGNHDLSLSIYNVYNRRNPYFIYLDTTTKPLIAEQEIIDLPIKVEAKQVSLFPIIPSLSWNFEF
nr:TonB-dependent receptor [Membranihabitans marinus]